MTEGMEICDFRSLRATSPPSPHNTRARGACARVLPTPDSAPAGSGAVAAAAMQALHGLGAKQPAIGPAPAAALPLRKRGARAGPSGVRKQGGRGKGTLGEGKSVIDEE